MVDTASEPVFFNPLDPGYLTDPHVQFAQLREHDPVHQSIGNLWFLFRHDDVFALLRDELRDQVSLLFIAGHETTVNLIGTGLYELLAHPDQWAVWRDDPSVGANAVDELLRFVSPVQFSRRITIADTVIGDKAIDTGSFVMAGLASANRDPAKWGPTAHELDLRRVGVGQHVSFGSGAHYCLGASLAKLEAQEAIGRFIARFDAELAADVEWNGRINLRGLAACPVTVV